jgi:hypothetical protein
MTAAIVATVLLALVAGAITGFGKRWEESLLLSGLVGPLIGAVVAGVLHSLALAFMTFFWSFLAASIIWGLAATIRHAVVKLCELTARSTRTRA